MVFLELHRIGPTVRVGPFESEDAAKAWVDKNTPRVTWGIIPLQAPTDGEPNWDLR